MVKTILISPMLRILFLGFIKAAYWFSGRGGGVDWPPLSYFTIALCCCFKSLLAKKSPIALYFIIASYLFGEENLLKSVIILICVSKKSGVLSDKNVSKIKIGWNFGQFWVSFLSAVNWGGGGVIYTSILKFLIGLSLFWKT